MLEFLNKWKGAVEINGTLYDNAESAQNACKSVESVTSIKLHATVQNAPGRPTLAQNTSSVNTDREEVITVKKYMTMPASPEFDFMAKWNNDVPMPMRTMRGTVEKETRGMVYMKLHGMGLRTVTCTCCGRELTNPVSRKYGVGPICLSKIGIARDIDDVDGIEEELAKIEWEGWIIKSAIIDKKVVDSTENV